MTLLFLVVDTDRTAASISKKRIPRAALRNDKQKQKREADSSRKCALRMTGCRKYDGVGEE
jgi:hypothetical protein